MRKKFLKFIVLILLMFALNFLILNNRTYAENNTQVIEDGEYEIASAMDESLCIDVTGGYKFNEANIQLYKYLGLASQKYNVKYIKDGYYSISSVNSNLMVDAAGAGKVNGTNVQQYQSNGHDAQKWIIRDAGNGYFNIVSKWNGLNIDITEAKAKNETNIQLFQNNGLKAQQWKFIRTDKKETPKETTPEKVPEAPKQLVKDGTYEIASALNEKLCLDVVGGYKFNEANIQLYKYVGIKSQKFTVKYYKDGYYTLTALHSNLMVDVAGAGKANGTNVQQYQFNGLDAQKWLIKDAGNGYFNIVSKWNGLNIDVKEAKAVNENNIQLFQNNGNKAQQWKFIEVDPSDSTLILQDGTYEISSVSNQNRCFDIEGAYKWNNANLQIYDYLDINSQIYTVKTLDDGSYTITPAHSNLSLTVVDSTKVQQLPYAGANTQKWIIKANSDGNFIISSKSNNLVLGVSNTNNETKVLLNSSSSSLLQTWKFTTRAIKNQIEVKHLSYTTHTSKYLSTYTGNLDTNKYPGYKEKLDAIKSSHPNWTIQLLTLPQSFESAINGERSYHGKNLVPKGTSGEYICEVCGTKYYDTGWYDASAKAVAYYMDPRNFLQEDTLFQFLDVNNYSGAYNVESIKKEVKGSFLEGYEQDLLTACQKQGVDPLYIITRLFQENGRTGSATSRGMYDSEFDTNFYDPFNIGASGNGTAEVLANALITAKNYGWSTMERALEGGIEFCKANWLANCQNTIYMNKFDIDDSNGTSLYSHQYMQNLMAAYSEGRTFKSLVNDLGVQNGNFTFIIPLFQNMGSQSQLPSTNSESALKNVKISDGRTQVRFRSQASTNSEILGTYDAGTVFLSLKRGVNSDWQYVIDSAGRAGYISNQFLTQINDVVKCDRSMNVKTNDGVGVKVRLGPGTSYDQIGYANENSRVKVIDDRTYASVDSSYTWYRCILENGSQGFIPAQYLR